MAHEVTLIPGDGTGPELVEATRRVLEATGVGFEWDERPAGEDVYAIAAVIKQGDKVTYDLKPKRDDPSAVGMSQFADAVIEEMN